MEEHLRRLYKAERLWRETNPEAAKTISMGGARDLVGEIINHPDNDDYYGIHDLRKSLNKRTVREYTPRLHGRINPTTGEREEWPDTMHAGMAANGVLVVRPERLNVGTVTHEATHMLERLGRQLRPEGLKEGHDTEFAVNHALNVQSILGRTPAERLVTMYQAQGVPKVTRRLLG
jgi:hypothetical protein